MSISLSGIMRPLPDTRPNYSVVIQLWWDPSEEMDDPGHDTSCEQAISRLSETVGELGQRQSVGPLGDDESVCHIKHLLLSPSWELPGPERPTLSCVHGWTTSLGSHQSLPRVNPLYLFVGPSTITPLTPRRLDRSERGPL